MGDREIPKNSISGGNGNTQNRRKKKKKNRGGTKRKLTHEQTLAYNHVRDWVLLGQCSKSSLGSAEFLDDFAVQWNRPKEKLVFDFHSHSTHSDGFLSPSKLVERAHQNGVNVLALTDHDTMSGIPEALEAARRFGIKIIPGVEISSIFYPRGESGSEEPVHILAYYSSCGPTKPGELEKFLSKIRDGRFVRARNMVLKLNKLKLPLKWENITKIAGTGVAPGRLHVARAMVEAGHVETLKQAFGRYLYDGGPAYSTGSEPVAEEAVSMIRETGGVAVLAHPWALKNPSAVVKRLKEAGLHGIETYRSDGKLSAFSDLADDYDLAKLGGSDYHGRGGQQESELGSVSLPMVSVHEFLKLARPIWCDSIRDILGSYANNPSESNLQLIMKFGKNSVPKGISPLASPYEFINKCLSSWLADNERENAELEAIRSKLSSLSVHE